MGNDLIYSTVLGGTSNDECHRVAADDSGNAFIIGQTISLDFPADDPFQTSSGNADGFIAKISPCCQMRGDVDGAEGIQISDPIYLIDYLFRGGPPPFCPEQGDTDNNGRINIADLTFLVDYLFRSGPPPPPCP
jgi:hypothetical protein